MTTFDSNGFPHQSYSKSASVDQFQIINRGNLVTPSSDSFSLGMSKVGKTLRNSGVSRIILVHGTMAGTDALGWYSHWHRVIPGISTKLKSVYKSVVDRLVGDKGNFTAEYASVLETALNQPHTGDSGTATEVEARIKVEQFHWTSENHHLGRADAAVRLVQRLLEVESERVLLIGHSHAANVFALTTNLMANSPERNKRFFEAARYFNASTGRIDVPTWRSIETELARKYSKRDPGKPLIKNELYKPTFATLGGPIRYGWNPDGFDKLLHFVNHRVVESAEDRQAEFRAFVPQTTSEWLAALKGEYGDFVQQCFIAQTDFPPAIWSWSAWKANGMLRDLLEGQESDNSRIWRFQQGKRVADFGLTLLIDYSKADNSATDAAGHSIYTELDSMEFQMKEISQRCFQ